MRKIVLVTVMLLIAVFVLASCGDCKHEDVVVDPAVAPTCTETGLTEGRHCAKCGAVIAAQETIPAAGHKEEAAEAKPAPEPKPEDIFVSKEQFNEVTSVLEGGLNDVKESIQQLISIQQSAQNRPNKHNKQHNGNVSGS